MILSKVYEDAERRLERNEITIGEFGRLVDIEVIKPKRGEWLEKIETNSDRTEVFYSIICSCCGFHTSYDETPYCPNCGADMRKGADE